MDTVRHTAYSTCWQPNPQSSQTHPANSSQKWNLRCQFELEGHTPVGHDLGWEMCSIFILSNNSPTSWEIGHQNLAKAPSNLEPLKVSAKMCQAQGIQWKCFVGTCWDSWFAVKTYDSLEWRQIWLKFKQHSICRATGRGLNPGPYLSLAKCET